MFLETKLLFNLRFQSVADSQEKGVYLNYIFYIL